MQDEVLDNFIKNNFNKVKIKELLQDASKRKYYRIKSNNKSFILLDSRAELKQFYDLLKIYEIIKDINISIPKIFNYDSNACMMILEDFGDNRFDKFINNPEYTSHLLKIAVDCLIVLKNSIKIKKNSYIQTYNIDFFKSELSEFVDWYIPFINKKNIDKKYKDDFYNIWEKKFYEIKLNSDSFVHRDYFCNNLFHLPFRNDHLKCGIIDYQGALLGDSVLDIVSLFEDSRRIINNYNKIELINNYLNKTQQIKQIDHFQLKYDFFGASRQTRILGRWVKLFKLNNKKEYLKYINTTWFWLEKNLNNPFLKEINSLYQDLVQIKKRKYEN